MLAVKNSRTRWAVAESGEKRAGSWIPPPEGFVQALSGFDQLLKAVLEASYCWGLPS